MVYTKDGTGLDRKGVQLWAPRLGVALRHMGRVFMHACARVFEGLFVVLYANIVLSSCITTLAPLSMIPSTHYI